MFSDEPPTVEEWQRRRCWFDKELEKATGQGSYLVSEQACALSIELERLYCSGAWVAVVIVAMAVVDAQLRETEVCGFRGNTKELINVSEAEPDLHWLRRLRNAYVHVDPDRPAITVDRHLGEQGRLERDARRAILLAFKAFFMSPGV